MSELRQIMEQILARHEAIDDIKDELRHDYLMAKSAGFDKTALGQAIREIRNRDKQDTAKAQETQALVSLYLAEFDGPSRTHAREAA